MNLTTTKNKMEILKNGSKRKRVEYNFWKNKCRGFCTSFAPRRIRFANACTHTRHDHIQIYQYFDLINIFKKFKNKTKTKKTNG